MRYTHLGHGSLVRAHDELYQGGVDDQDGAWQCPHLLIGIGRLLRGGHGLDGLFERRPDPGTGVGKGVCGAQGNCNAITTKAGLKWPGSPRLQVAVAGVVRGGPYVAVSSSLCVNPGPDYMLHVVEPTCTEKPFYNVISS